METVLTLLLVSFGLFIAKIWWGPQSSSSEILSALRKGNFTQAPIPDTGIGIGDNGWDCHIYLTNEEIQVSYGRRPGTSPNEIVEAFRIKLHQHTGETLVRFVNGVLLFVSINGNLYPPKAEAQKLGEIRELIVQAIQ